MLIRSLMLSAELITRNAAGGGVIPVACCVELDPSFFRRANVDPEEDEDLDLRVRLVDIEGNKIDSVASVGVTNFIGVEGRPRYGTVILEIPEPTAAGHYFVKAYSDDDFTATFSVTGSDGTATTVSKKIKGDETHPALASLEVVEPA